MLVDLVDNRLYLIDQLNNKIIKNYPIAGGKPTTPSPLGTFTIISKGEWSAGFGTRWMGLNVPWGRYGIHGTNKPLSIGGHVSLGCIRMLNMDVEDLYKLVGYGTPVCIYGGPYNMFVNEFRVLDPGNTGSDVYEVQRRLKDKGYYSGPLDGRYGEGMKAQVIKFRKDNNLKITHTIDKEFYNAMQMKPFE
ncbi:L,D-transpeptidase family protein [Clostridium rhizosphaerae]|uniref:L,D-transpeptidase family protein n=1 Tax=Clostridium rhizosphaerae TaxID=2803861 RepID=UPI003084435E